MKPIEIYKSGVEEFETDFKSDLIPIPLNEERVKEWQTNRDNDIKSHIKQQTILLLESLREETRVKRDRKSFHGMGAHSKKSIELYQSAIDTQISQIDELINNIKQNE
jgi:thymidylate synthase